MFHTLGTGCVTETGRVPARVDTPLRAELTRRLRSD